MRLSERTFSIVKPDAVKAGTGGQILARLEGAGFKKNPMEWWHYDLPGATKLPVQDVPFTKDESTPVPK